MKMKKEYSGIPARIREIIEDTVEQNGCFLWDIEFARRGADSVLTVTVDSDDGVGIDECERVSRAIDPLLDEADPIDCSYSLEVSTPGIERSLTMPWHFTCCEGEDAELRLFSPLPGTASKTIRCVISGYDAETDAVRVLCGEQTLTVPFGALSSARLTYDFSKEQ